MASKLLIAYLLFGLLFAIVVWVSRILRRCSRFEAYDELTNNYKEVWELLGSPDIRYLAPALGNFKNVSNLDNIGGVWKKSAAMWILKGNYKSIESDKLKRYFRHERLRISGMLIGLALLVLMLLAAILPASYELLTKG